MQTTNIYFTKFKNKMNTKHIRTFWNRTLAQTKVMALTDVSRFAITYHHWREQMRLKWKPCDVKNMRKRNERWLDVEKLCCDVRWTSDSMEIRSGGVFKDDDDIDDCVDVIGVPDVLWNHSWHRRFDIFIWVNERRGSSSVIIILPTVLLPL